MPVAPTYPGVYIEEIPSGVRTITGVATSITAFVGRAQRGPSNEPTTIFSFADFERQFGGLDPNYPMSYAVRDFYGNGGSQAIIVRVLYSNVAGQSVVQAAAAVSTKNPAATAADVAKGARTQANTFKSDPDKTAADFVAKEAEKEAGKASAKPDDVVNAAQAAVSQAPGLPKPATITLSPLSGAKNEDLVIVGATLGTWADDLVAWVDYNTNEEDVPLDPKTKKVDDTQRHLFNLYIGQKGKKSQPPLLLERYLNVAFEDGNARYLPRVLKQSSNLVRVQRTADDTDWVPFTLPAAVDQSNAAEAEAGFDGGLLSGDLPGDPDKKTGIYALEKADLFNLFCIPPDTRGGDTDVTTYQAAMKYCQDRRAMLIVDSPAAWGKNKETAAAAAIQGLGALGLTGLQARNAALYFPRVVQPDPLRQGQLDTFVPCGIIAGVMANTDVTRGVWKAPAGIDAALNGIAGLEVNLSNDENGELNPLGINCLRTFPIYGSVVWGARTLRGADVAADDYKYVPVRRLALFLEESLYRGTQWVVFEPNDEPLWAQIRLNVGAFMHDLFVKGAFQGQTPKDAYFVKCDKESTTQNDINLGIVNVVVGFAPLKPAEFVILQIQQMAGNILT